MKRGSKLIQLKNNQKEKVKFRKKWWKKQNKKCALLGVKIPFDKTVVDHKHKLIAQKAGPKGRGLVRGIIDHQANAFLGKVENAFKRYGMGKYGSLRNVLNLLCDYVENPPMPPKYIHWNEAPKKEILKKSEYNLIVKHYFDIHPRAKQIPEYPKSGIKISNKGKKTYKAKKTEKWVKLLKKIGVHLGRG